MNWIGWALFNIAVGVPVVVGLWYFIIRPNNRGVTNE